MTLDELYARKARLEVQVGGPEQVRDASGRFIAYGSETERQKALAYVNAEIAKLESAAARLVGTGGRRQVYAVYGGRGY